MALAVYCEIMISKLKIFSVVDYIPKLQLKGTFSKMIVFSKIKFGTL